MWVLCLALWGHALGAEPTVATVGMDGRTGQGVRLKAREMAAEQLSTLAEARRIEAIQRLEALLDNPAPDDVTRAEMMLRLADLYFQQGRSHYLDEYGLHFRRVEACDVQPSCDPSQLEPVHEVSFAWYRKSVRVYEALLRSFPRTPRADEATYYLGSALQDLGRADEASQVFRRLVKHHPDSGFAPDAYVHLGDYFFDQAGDVFKALVAYRRAVAFEGFTRRVYAQYRLAWANYNVGELEEAIGTMRRVVHASSDDPEAARLQLREEALRDLVRFVADAENLDHLDIFVELGREDLARLATERLAVLWLEQGKMEQGVGLLRRLILEAPEASASLDHQAEIVAALQRMGRRDDAMTELARLVTTYAPGAAWAAAQDPDDAREGAERVEQIVRKAATTWHATARRYEDGGRRGDAALVLALARKGYELHLAHFGAHDRATDVRYGYAELLYAQGDFRRAHDAYVAVVEADPEHEQARFCAESAVFAAEELMKRASSGGDPPRAVAKDLPPQPLSEPEALLVAAADRYVERFGGPKAKDMLYKSAYVLYDRHRFEEAAARFSAVIRMDPRSREARYSAQLILDALAVRESWAALARVSKGFLESPALGTPSFRQDMANIHERASFKVIEVALEGSGDKATAADAFRAHAQAFPQGETAAQALHNAAVYYDEVGRLADSIAVRTVLVDDPRFGAQAPHFVTHLGALGFAHERVAAFAEAADRYEQLAAVVPEGVGGEGGEGLVARVRDALYSAGVLRHALGDREAAIANYRAWMARFPDDGQVAQVRLRIARILEQSSRWPEATEAYLAFASAPPEGATDDMRRFARLRAGRALERMGRTQERDAIYRAEVAAWGEPDEHEAAEASAAYIAEMRFVLAAPVLERYRSARIVGESDRALERALVQKVAALREVESALTGVVSTGDGTWGLTALVTLGDAYADMAEGLRASERPEYLNERQRRIYDLEIEDRAYLQEEKAVRAYELALERAKELLLFEEATAMAARRLSALRPDRIAGLAESLDHDWWTVAAAPRARPGWELTADRAPMPSRGPGGP